MRGEGYWSAEGTTRRSAARPTKAHRHGVRIRDMKPFLPIAVLATLAIAPAADPDSYTYKVTSATHTSTSHKTEEGYNGTSTARWSLAKPTRMAPNKMTVS